MNYQSRSLSVLKKALLHFIKEYTAGMAALGNLPMEDANILYQAAALFESLDNAGVLITRPQIKGISSQSPGPRIGENTHRVDENIDEVTKTVKTKYGTYEERNKNILAMHDNGASRQEIADRYNLTESRISQIISQLSE